MELLTKPFPRLSYSEAIERFGTDKPDLRYGMELIDVSDIAGKSDFRIFTQNVAEGRPVKALCAKSLGGYSRKQMSELEEIAKEAGAKGLAWIALPEGGEVRGSVAKFFPEELRRELFERLGAEEGDLILMVTDEHKTACEALGALRVELAHRLGLDDPDKIAFAWIIDFPLFEWDEEGQRWDPSHHLFTSPMPEDIPLLDSEPGKARGQQYDLVCNGYELAGGSIRIHQRWLQEKIFGLIGLDMATAKERFGHMLEAFEYGTPPHGGIAMGIDRLAMIIAREPNIREVMAFPKTQQAVDLMADTPSEVEPEQLEELHISTKNGKEVQ